MGLSQHSRYSGGKNYRASDTAKTWADGDWAEAEEPVPDQAEEDPALLPGGVAGRGDGGQAGGDGRERGSMKIQYQTLF